MTKHSHNPNNQNNKKAEHKSNVELEPETKSNVELDLESEQEPKMETVELQTDIHTVIPFSTALRIEDQPDAYTTEYISNTEFEYANKDPDSTKTNKHILDPLSVIIKLCILSKKPLGTKCCVYNNVLYIHEKSPLQCFIRFLYKINKFELNYLYNPIYIACQKYLCGPTKKRIENLFICAQKGLKHLIETYSEYNHIKHMLIMYSTIIDTYISDKQHKYMFVKDNNTCLYNTTVLEKSEKIWRTERITLLINMIDFVHNDVICKYKYDGETTKLLEEFQAQIDAEFVADFI